MAIRVQTRAVVNFGNNTTAARTATHIRLRESDDSNPIVRPLPQAITYAIGAPMTIPAGLYDIVYPAGEVQVAGNTEAIRNGHMMDVIAPWWGDADKNGVGNKSMEMDLMSDATTAFNGNGYAQQTVNDWSITAEAD